MVSFNNAKILGRVEAWAEMYKDECRGLTVAWSESDEAALCFIRKVLAEGGVTQRAKKKGEASHPAPPRR